MTHTISKIITTDKIARVEGTGNIEVEIENNIVKDVKVNIFEGPRLVEEIVKGKDIDEVISIVPRICAICNLSHKIATLTAMRNATNTQVSDHAWWFGKLMHMGEMIESHTLHLYFLVLPDVFRVPSAIHLLDEHGATVTEGLGQKKFANKIMYLAGGNRMIHGENPKVGGYGKYPSIEVLKSLASEAKERLSDAIRLVEILGTVDLPSYGFKDTTFICVEPPDNEFGFYGDYIITSTGKRVKAEDYNSIFTERLVPHSFAKRALHENQPYTVGSIARLLNLKDRLSGKAGELLSKYYSIDWKINPLYNNFAQAIENVYCMEQVPIYAEKLIKLLKVEKNPPNVPYGRLSGRGVGTVEAPRGLLIHDYTLENGILNQCNIVTPTAQNLDDIELHLKTATEYMLKEQINDKEMEFNLEMLTRSYDPCISCSAHMVKIKRN